MNVPTSESQKAAVRKHQQEKLDEIKLRPPKGTKERWKAAANLSGQSLSQFIADAVETRIKKGAKCDGN